MSPFLKMWNVNKLVWVNLIAPCNIPLYTSMCSKAHASIPMQITLGQNMTTNTYYLDLFIHLAPAVHNICHVFICVVINIQNPTECR